MAPTTPMAPATPMLSANSVSVPPGLSADQVKASILEGLAARKLIVLDQSEGKISAYHARKNITLTLIITYQADQVTIEVKQWDSRPRVVRTQEGWLVNIRKSISDALLRRKAFNQ